MTVQALRAEARAGLLFLVSPALAEAGVPHAFTTRLGGVSCGSFAGLNLGRATGDDPRHVTLNRARVAAALGFCLPDVRAVAQVHGAEVVDGDVALAGDADEREGPAADGLVSGTPGTWLSVRGADCPLLLLAAPGGRRVAALHCGWRGQAAGIIATGVGRLCATAGCAPGELSAALGPGIGAVAYEVGPEVARHFDSAHVRPGRDDRHHLDLHGAAIAELARLGVWRVDAAASCTAAASSLYYSHRRDGARSGRQWGLIGVPR